MKDKDLEKKRYNERAFKILTKDNNLIPIANGIDAVPLILRTPYVEYHKLLKKICFENKDVLELGSGTGQHTGGILKTNANLIATDISKFSLEVLKKRYKNHINLKTNICDMENLQFPDETFDVVASAGSLSYGDTRLVLENIYRVLKPGGMFICVDSLDDNFIYKFNRFLNYLLGKRTYSTLCRMPNLKKLGLYKKKFSQTKIKFYGSLVWIAPLISKIIGADRTLQFIDYTDSIIGTKRSAFKFVMLSKK